MNDIATVPRNHGSQARARLRGRVLLVGLFLAPIVAIAGCSLDELLEVEVPGVLVAENLNDPGLAQTLVLGVQTDFECAFGSYVWGTGVWADEWDYGGATNNEIVYALRLQRLTDLGQQTRATECTTIATYLPLHTARNQAVVATELIEGFEVVEERDFKLAKIRAFEAYSLLLLGEAYCRMTIDGQPPISREATWEMAKAKFGEAIALAGNGGSNATAVLNLARVGRARTNLNLGDFTALRQDAESVPADFIYNATFAAQPQRRNNTLVERNEDSNGTSLTMHPSFLDLEVDGVPDPRVPWDIDGGTFLNQNYPIYRQLKYATNASPMPIASGREAQLMVAEAMGGSAAVTIINNLRATVGELDFVADDHPGLPPVAAGLSEAEIQATIQEERRRELWLQGHRIGDKLRYDESWETGNDPFLRSYGTLTCIPLHVFEEESI